MSQNDFFNQTIFTAQLEHGVHNLVLTNDEDEYLDVDYIAFETTIGELEEPLIINSYQDVHPAFNYSPSSSWDQADQASWFSGSSGHQSYDPSSTAQLAFNGVAVALYGSVGPSGSEAFGVKVDDQPLRNLSAKRAQFRAQQLLFWAGGLTPGDHTLRIQPHTYKGALAIDYANAYTTQSLGGSYNNASKQNTTADRTFSNTHPSISIVIALALTSTVAFISLLGLAALIWKYRHDIFPQRRRTSIQSVTQVRPYLITDRLSTTVTQIPPSHSSSSTKQSDRVQVNPSNVLEGVQGRFLPKHGLTAWEERATPGSSASVSPVLREPREMRPTSRSARHGVVSPPEYTPLLNTRI